MSIEMWHAIGARVHTGSMRVLAGRLHVAAGDIDGAMAAAKSALAAADETGSVAASPDALALLAIAGPPDHAEAGLLEALALAEEHGATLSAVRIATELVRLSGEVHRDRLEGALAALDADGVHAPVLDAARSLLAAP
jgi:hypothetical protein